MGKERILEATKKKKFRASGFIHIGEIIPGVLEDIEGKIKKSAKGQKTSNVKIDIVCIPDLKEKISENVKE